MTKRASWRGAAFAAALAALLAGASCVEVDSAGDGDGASRPPVKREWPEFRGGQALSGVAPGRLPKDLTLLWRFKAEGGIVASAVVGDGLVFVGSTRGRLYAVRLADGEKAWSAQLGGAIEAPALLLDRNVCVGATDGTLYAFEAASGETRWVFDERWTFKTGDKIVGAANWARSPGGEARRIFVGSYDFRLYCLDAETGEKLWHYEADNYINGGPAVDEGRVVFGGCDAVLRVLSVADGAEKAAVDVGSYVAASPALRDGFAYVGTMDGPFVAADLSSGRIAWEYAEADDAFYASAAVSDDRVVVGSRDGFVHAMDRRTGRPLWTFETGGEVDSSPVICGDEVVVGSGDGSLYVLALADGTKRWSFELGGGVTASPAVAGDRLVIGSTNGNLFAFGPPASEGE